MPQERRGLLFGVLAYGFWGLLPLYWLLLRPGGALEILAHRMLWSLVFMALVVTVLRHWRRLAAVARTPRQALPLTGAAILITVNWATYIYGVNSGHVVETALGYFVNPLVTVLLGVVVLRERLRAWQWVALGLGGVAVAVLVVAYGRLPWIALVLSLTFGTYGLLKKKAAVAATESFTFETAVMVLPALAYLIWLQGSGGGHLTGYGALHVVLLVSTGVVTAIPLLCFGAAAVRLPLTTLGMLQYLAPTLQFVTGVALLHEAMPAGRWAGFVLVWLALVVLTVDGVRRARRTGPRERAGRAGRTPENVVPGESTDGAEVRPRTSP